MTNLALNSSQIDRNALTPMLQHYMGVKDRYSHAVLLYRMGDFFETFFEDAQLVSRELELVLTGRDGGKTLGRIPMAGIPHHALDRYARQLVAKGFSIAICDQVETAAQAQGLVKREVTRVLTPGTVIEAGMLAAKQNNFLAAIVAADPSHQKSNGNSKGNKKWGLAFADISTGEFMTTQLANTEQLVQELLRLQPAEVLFPTDAPNPNLFDSYSNYDDKKRSPQLDAIPPELPDFLCYTLRSQTSFLLVEAKQKIMTTYKVRSLEGFGCASLSLAIRAAGGLLEYLDSTQKDLKAPLHNLTTYTVTDYLILDHQTRRNLEITQTVRDGTLAGSLLWALDCTSTSMGSRALRRWLLQPLKDTQQISDRADTVAELFQHHNLRKNLRALLHEIYDIERLCSRIGAGTANARDLVALADSLSKLTDVADLLAKAESPYLKTLQSPPLELAELANFLSDTLIDSPPIYLTEGNIIRDGVSPQIDQIRQQSAADVEWLATLEKTERERTGINTLKVGYNKAFGYYLSISRGKSDQAPDDYIRKQTLTNEERFITPELKEREARILNAKAEINQLEYDLFVQLRSQAATHITAMRSVARDLAAADALASLAEVANKYDYCRPEITSDRTINIQNGRHPVVEQSLPSGFFVPNSARLGCTQAPDLIILTGPNMSGKSIYLRQVGLIQLMAQVGSFVPAQSATLGISDRIFTRVGAVDDLATGQSTFMVEMNETANILNHAQDHSLVLLDEIGRGTSTFDGMAIAWSVAEHIAKQIQARAIFATHYHELNELASLLTNVTNFQVTVKELEDEIIFLHQVQPGGADRSYGIEVGRLAGLPPAVIARAKQVLEQIARNSHIATGLRRGSSAKATKGKKNQAKSQLSIFETSMEGSASHNQANPDLDLDSATDPDN